jgi:hypothetical protein
MRFGNALFAKRVDIHSPRALLHAVQLYALRFQRSVKMLQLNKYCPRLMALYFRSYTLLSERKMDFVPVLQ